MADIERREPLPGDAMLDDDDAGAASDAGEAEFETDFERDDDIEAVAAEPAGVQEAATEEAAAIFAVETLAGSLTGLSSKIARMLDETKVLNNGLRQSTTRYLGIIKSYDEVVQKKNRHMMLVLVAGVCVMLVSLSLVLFMSASFGKQVTNMNALSLSLGRRLAEVNSGLVTFEELNASIQGLNMAVLQVATATEAQAARLDDFSVSLNEDGAENFTRIRELLASQGSVVTTALQQLESAVSRQSEALSGNTASLQTLQRELATMNKSVQSLLALRASVDALITLEKEQYLEQLTQQQRNETRADEQQALIRFQRQESADSLTP